MGEKNISVRKISNGYVLSESRYTKGGYECKETFCKEEPKVVVKPEGKPTPKATANPMSRAKKELSR